MYGTQHTCSMFNTLATTLATNNCRSPFPGTQTTALEWADTTRAGKAIDGHRKKKTQSLVQIKRANDRIEKSSHWKKKKI